MKRIIRKRVRLAPGDEDVGYGRPPKAHQFKPGQSGNPRGRPKGAKNEATILTELLNRKIPIREHGKIRKISVREGILHKIAEDSLKGNIKSATFMLNRSAAIEAMAGSEAEISPDDKAVLDAYLRNFQSKLAGRGTSR